ncbi:hypothetical protein APY04_3513 [Hyphomicrobium sulfonivorans]|uniref:Uncharacterized protein n=1 Tax=Hyphomicrobium sulfonivorans TaxID=121290 RepID=A0A109B8Q6_HYPSL|nr:hypothetical protein [Hyphomicrobium sulfonivorans]KWT64249.1 hypothetical protein APY04_3513 [Hyphomicrobium sulfonivorans]
MISAAARYFSVARAKGLRHRVRQSTWRLVAEGCIKLSVLEAAHRLSKSEPIVLLVDNSVLGHAVTHDTVWIDTGTKMWGGTVPVQTGYAARIPVHRPDNNSRIYREVTYLVGIAELARRGLIRLVTSSELMSEWLRHPIGRFSGYGWDDHHLFEGIEMPSVDGYVLDLKDAKQRQLQRLSASSEQPFKDLSSHFPPKDNLDVWHVHTAHRYGIHGFLTVDFGFVEKFEKQGEKLKPYGLVSRPVLPSDLGQSIGLRPIPTFMLSYRNARFAVHPELSSPDQKRASPNRRAKSRGDEQ